MRAVSPTDHPICLANGWTKLQKDFASLADETWLMKRSRKGLPGLGSGPPTRKGRIPGDRAIPYPQKGSNLTESLSLGLSPSTPLTTGLPKQLGLNYLVCVCINSLYVSLLSLPLNNKSLRVRIISHFLTVSPEPRAHSSYRCLLTD